jgi:hypothetical protein
MFVKTSQVIHTSLKYSQPLHTFVALDCGVFGLCSKLRNLFLRHFMYHLWYEQAGQLSHEALFDSKHAEIVNGSLQGNLNSCQSPVLSL